MIAKRRKLIIFTYIKKLCIIDNTQQKTKDYWGIKMTLMKGKKILGVIAASLPLAVVGTLFVASNNPFNRSKASAYTAVLDNDNAPTLNNGEGTVVDDKNVTWEYHNASDLANGHVSLSHQGYFGVSSSTTWGYTGISELTATFTCGEGAELWLLTSIDGENWNEQIALTSGEPTTYANDWRYIRFYCWNETNTPMNVTSVSFDYECSGISSSDDMDLASDSNVASTSNLTTAVETSIKSPLGNSQEAVSLIRTANNSYCEFYLKEERNVLDFHTKVIEFDFYHANNQNKPQVAFANNKKTIGTTGSYSGTKTNYRFTSINSDWWHIQVHITSLVVPAVSHADSATHNDPVDRIRITSGNCVIDNLRITCIPSNENNGLGIYNNGTSMSKGGYYWMKVSWAGVLHQCTFTYDNDGYISQEVGAAHPFYLYGEKAGTVLVTAHLVVGYDRRNITISNTITVN